MAGKDDTGHAVPISAEEKAELDREYEEQGRRLREQFKRRLDEDIKQSINDRIYSVWD